MVCEYGISRRTGRNRAPSAATITSVYRTQDPGLRTPSRSPQPPYRSTTTNGAYLGHSRSSSSLSDSLTVNLAGHYPYSGPHTPQYMPPSPPLNTPAIITPLGTPRVSLAPVPLPGNDYWLSAGADGNGLLANMASPGFPSAEAASDPSLGLLNMPHDPFLEFNLSMSDLVDDGFTRSGSSSSSGSENGSFDANGFTSSSPSPYLPHSSNGLCISSAGNDGSSLLANTVGGCLTTALGMLARLFPSAGAECIMSSAGQTAGSSQLRTTESVVSENREVVESLTRLLDCPCTQDEYTLSIISLAVFRALDSYAAATSAGTYRVDGGDQGPATAQRVLGELPRVHHLVNILSERIEGVRLRRGTMVRSSSHSSVPMFEQLEQDLRKRLQAVSSETIELLRCT